MLRMEIALILVLGFVAYIYYSAERTQTVLVVFLFISILQFWWRRRPESRAGWN